MGFEISCKLTPLCCLLRRQFARNVKAYFIGKKKKKSLINLSSAEFAQGVVKVQLVIKQNCCSVRNSSVHNVFLHNQGNDESLFKWL